MAAGPAPSAHGSQSRRSDHAAWLPLQAGMSSNRTLKFCTALTLVAMVGGCNKARTQKIQDEATLAGLEDGYFKHADEDYFREMDNGVDLTPEEIRGRNMWLVWTAGNDRFWDYMSRPTFGGFDLLKLVAPDPNGAN